MPTWDREEMKQEYNQEICALSKEENVELNEQQFEELPDEDDPYWEE